MPSRRTQNSKKVSGIKSPSRVRIIAGEWRGRQIEFVDQPGLRPTGDRIRETLFNWLQADVVGAHCLDLYAGSGVLGFEALSRGAASVTLVDNNPEVTRMLTAQINKLGTDHARVVNRSAIGFLDAVARGGECMPLEGFDIIFVDPPFADHVQIEIVHQMTDVGMLRPQTIVYVEGPAELSLSAFSGAGFESRRSGLAGNVRYQLLEKTSD